MRRFALAADVGQAQRLPLRAVDWRAVLLADPHVTALGGDAQGGEQLGPRLEVTLGVAGKTVRGLPDYDRIESGALDGDGAREALIPFFSSGAGGHCTGACATLPTSRVAPRPVIGSVRRLRDAPARNGQGRAGSASAIILRLRATAPPMGMGGRPRAP